MSDRLPPRIANIQKPRIVKIEKETMFGTPLSPLPFLAFDEAEQADQPQE